MSAGHTPGPWNASDPRDALIADLVDALRPFAQAATLRLCGDWRDDESIQRTDTAFHVKFGHLRAARALLARIEGTKP